MLPARSAERRALKYGFVGSLASALIGLAGEVPWWPADPACVRTLYFIAAALLLLYAIYSLSWGHAYTDALTGQTNRRALDEALGRLGRTYAIAIADIDNFKRLNDRYGHRVGDEVLAFVAGHLRRSGIGKLYRYGGEEFVLLCPGSTARELRPHIEELRKTLAASRFVRRSRVRDPKLRGKSPRNARSGHTIKVTISVGLADDTGDASSPDQVLRAADKALYRAKRQGKNRTVATRTRSGR
jgi:diguanylate cyclase (GGDEF)-like protein